METIGTVLGYLVVVAIFTVLPIILLVDLFFSIRKMRKIDQEEMDREIHRKGVRHITLAPLSREKAEEMIKSYKKIEGD